VNAIEYIWRNLSSWFRRKRNVAFDAEIYETLLQVAEREQRSPQDVAAHLVIQASQDQSVQAWVLQCWDQLSPRQKQITAYVCRGDSTSQIAAQLSIAQTTVKSHVEAVLRKFGVKSRVALRKLLEPWDLNSFL